MNTNILKQNGFTGYFQRILFIILIPLAQCLYFLINLTTKSAHDVTIFLDKLIPFNEWFVIPYVIWYVYTFGILLVLAFYDNKTYYKLLFSIVIGMLICLLIYYIYPSTVPRPEVGADNILKRMVLIIYSSDKPYNCFPSIHMLDTFLITMYLLKYNKKVLVKASSVILCVAIYWSTLSIKQHSILDAVASTVLGIILFVLFENQYIAKKMYDLKNLLIGPKSQSSLNEDI